MVIQSDATTNKYPPIASTAAVIAALPRVIHRLSASSRRAIRIFKTPQRFTLLGRSVEVLLDCAQKARTVGPVDGMQRAESDWEVTFAQAVRSQRNQLVSACRSVGLSENPARFDGRNSPKDNRDPAICERLSQLFIKLLSGREFSIPPDRITLFREEGCQSSCFGPIDRGVANENVCHCCPRQPMKQRCKLSNSRNCVDPPDTGFLLTSIRIHFV